ncbi:MAG TPA: DUF2141 domain-containing protein [Cyclobacteriaceae bacterium]|nr:DUF2141 domain-containing protein [Cyclobacteriaceae bacterium]
MKHLGFFILFLNIVALATAQDLVVTIKNVSDQPGTLMAGLFNSEKTFLKKAVRGEKVAARPGTVKVVFKDVQPGEYALSVFHDANDDGKLDTNFFGIPKEGVGASNDVVGKFGPPSYEKAKFECPRSEEVSVTMKYY